MALASERETTGCLLSILGNELFEGVSRRRGRLWGVLGAIAQGSRVEEMATHEKLFGKNRKETKINKTYLPWRVFNKDNHLH